MIRHIGLNINDLSEVDDFYHSILGFEVSEEFFARKEICKIVFNEEVELKVFRLEKFGLELELFISDKINAPTYQHICIEYWKASEIYKKAQNQGYKTISFTKDNGRQAYFIYDKANNLFELKDINYI